MNKKQSANVNQNETVKNTTTKEPLKNNDVSNNKSIKSQQALQEEHFMLQALNLAQKAFNKNEVPVGAIIVKGGKIIAKAYNKRQRCQNALYHAEILAINRACKKLKSFRLENCTMYVTMEPCPMCSGAIINARLQKVYFGCYDSNYGCCGSKYNFLQDKAFEHIVEVEGGVLEEDCSKILKTFFENLRKTKKQKKLQK